MFHLSHVYLQNGLTGFVGLVYERFVGLVYEPVCIFELCHSVIYFLS